ncbi:hypothetical protein EDD80_101530 [Anseongella ginsenosidimutans]|uniref:LTXXQ motif family protein n=1 Tax=Anseongella ginsenosidimutans TaxID=496056 RepID=A0A4R3L090_9SPHI|nr:hypothetical protein [Anseongella ginsenosidimutans]QEC51018.1 hypothetical protein FRZ59_00725 [Anseongella ginsenosidimutans]TCS90330.1 hypothetical protein EDD80_101530 [Anseongella ginsenosidimutans]
MKYLKIFLFACLIFPAAAQAQRPGREEIESLRVAIFTKHMELTAAESKVFWPVYNNFREEMDKLHRNRRERMGRLRKEIDALSDSQVKTLVEEEVGYYEKEAVLTRKYNEQFKKILPIKKVAKLYTAEEAFKRELIDRLRESRHRSRG